MSRHKNSFVYFVRPVGLHGPVKIGSSNFPVSRLETLMSWAPVPLEIAATIPGSFELERRIQGVFAKHHSHREWFFPSQELSDFIAAVAAGKPLVELIDLDAPIESFRKIKKRASSPARTMYMSYSARVRCAAQKLRTEDAYFSPPKPVNDIVHTWRADFEAIPCPADLAALEAFVANPEATAVRHSTGLRVIRGGAA